MTLKFKSEAEFKKWEASLKGPQRLRVVASRGETVAAATAAPAATWLDREPRARFRLPTRRQVALAWGLACWAACAAGALGVMFCLGKMCGEAHISSLLP